MPWYDYRCDTCEHEFEVELPVDRRDEAVCPRCASRDVRRTMPSISVLVKAGSDADAGCACGEGGCGCCGV